MESSYGYITSSKDIKHVDNNDSSVDKIESASLECGVTISNIEDVNDTSIDDYNSSSGISVQKLKKLRDIISTLDLCEQTEILKIIEKNKIKFTENKNGIFINMNKLTINVIDEITHFLEYINNNYKKNLI